MLTSSTIKQTDVERFQRIQRDVHMGYGVTLKDLALLVRLVETLDKGGLLKVKVKKTVNFFFVEVADAAAPHGKKFGVECDACGEQFFDRVSAGKNPRLLASGIPVAIAHAKQAHQSTGGQVGHRKESTRGLRAKSVSAD